MRSVASTTLLTFRVDVPLDAFSVELRGSWDNFNHSYQLQRDQRRSSINWVGIFTFKDIICDGDLESPSEKREGCLRMGGTYWYHYVVNGVYEFCDHAQPSTTRCPFLPGEDLNILDVPCEEAPEDLQDFVPQPADTPAFTWNPQARFSTPRPNKFEALARKAQPPPPSPTYSSPVTPSCENPDFHDFSSNSSAKRPYQGSIPTSPDEDIRPPSRNPSAQSNDRPWTSSDEDSMKSARMREKVTGLLRRARSLTSIARKISQKQKKSSTPGDSSNPSSVPESIQEQPREEFDSTNGPPKDSRDVPTSDGTVGCWAHQQCWQSDESRTRRTEELDSTRDNEVAGWVESQKFTNGDENHHDDDADADRDTDGLSADHDGIEHAMSVHSPNDSVAGYQDHDPEIQCQQSPGLSQSPETIGEPHGWLHLPADDEDWHGYSQMFGQPQMQKTTGRRYGAAPQRHNPYADQRPHVPMYQLQGDAEPTADATYYEDDSSLFERPVKFEHQRHAPQLDYTCEGDYRYYPGTGSFIEDQRHYGLSHPELFWGPDNWKQPNLTADIARNPTFAEDDPLVCCDEDFQESACPDEDFSELLCPDGSEGSSPPSDDGSWTNTSCDSNDPVSRFNSILRRYRGTNDAPVSVHTEEDDSRENNPSTPTQDSGFLGYSLPEEESTSQATLTKVPTHTTVVRRGSFSNAPKLELNLDGSGLGDWSSLSEHSTTLDDLENFGF
ncbi:uncharacterized protein BKA78DRAFT_296401 [Phyllosticta capitalensis]|uniref:Uncharacterized protein n=1 Tax=Phyllosticta capitalensis TaxID=121624 RepID=A0ABR1YMK5_9PEZI